MCTGLQSQSWDVKVIMNSVAQYLERHGIRPILNYAAEDDVNNEFGCEGCPVAAAERKLDRNLDIFMRSIRDSDNVRNRAFVAIKVRRVKHFILLLPTATCS